MKVIFEKNLKPIGKKTAVALGSFETIHKGHIKIISKTVSYAKENGLFSVISIFKDPILKNENTACETLEERLELLESLGADIVVVFDFNEKFRSLSYVEFFEYYIIDVFNAKKVFTGFNYRFGNKAEGDTKKLEILCKKSGTELFVESPVKEKELISSTYIRSLILKGDAKEIINYLSRPYSVSGTVEPGRKIGSKIGFPTANISYPKNKVLIKDGVYFGRAIFDGKSFFCIINVGEQPTVTKEHTPKIEVHLLDFCGDLYGKKIKTEFLKKIRDQKSFANLSQLKAQLEQDKNNAIE